MTTDAAPAQTSQSSALLSVARRFRWIYLAPVLAFLALAAWSFASPVGAGPDDDYHLVSIWCANGGSSECAPGSETANRDVDPALLNSACYMRDADKSAACQDAVWANRDGSTIESTRGNFVGEYPPVYYGTMRVFATDDIQTSALVMRLVNAALFVGLATALAVLMPSPRRQTLLWGWLVTIVPLGMFLISSNNPSGWAVTGVGTAFLALLGWLETPGRRRWVLAGLFLIGLVMAGGSRGDAAVYAAGAIVTATLLAFPTARPLWRAAWLPALGLVVCVFLFTLSGQTGVVNSGFGGEVATSGVPGAVLPDAPVDKLALAAYNLLMLPSLWTGVWGTWALGWFDTGLPAIVPWAAVSAFVVVAFAGIGRLSWRKAIAAAGVLLVLIVLPVHVLTAGGDRVGVNLQPRYLLPLIVLFAFVLLTDPARRGAVRFTRVQTFAILAALGVANLVSLQTNIRRYVTGTDEQGFNLDSGAEWWWSGLPIGPTAVWMIGVLAFAGLLALLWPQLRRETHVAENGSASVDAEQRHPAAQVD